jgi:hypothetical protein
MAEKPTYRCECHGFVPMGSGWVMQMVISDDHAAYGYRAGTSGHTSKIKSIDFERGIVETRNSIYIMEPA